MKTKLLLVAFLVVLTACKPEADRLRDQEALAQAQAAAAQAAAQPPMSNQVATTGVGVKGDSLNDIGPNSPGGIIAAPAKAYFRVKEKVVFEIQLPSAKKLYNATHGRDPKSHEEFMEQIINANKINLPQLPTGMIYRYHPDDGELWVEADKVAAGNNASGNK